MHHETIDECVERISKIGVLNIAEEIQRLTSAIHDATSDATALIGYMEIAAMRLQPFADDNLQIDHVRDYLQGAADKARRGFGKEHKS